MAQVISLSDAGISGRLAAAVALTLLANQELLGQHVAEFGGNREDGFELIFVTEAAAREEFGLSVKADKDSDIQASVTASPPGEQQLPTLVVIHDGYAARSNMSAYPENKAFVWVLMNVHGALVAHCSRQDRSKGSSRVMAVRSREFCQSTFT